MKLRSDPLLHPRQLDFATLAKPHHIIRKDLGLQQSSISIRALTGSATKYTVTIHQIGSVRRCPIHSLAQIEVKQAARQWCVPPSSEIIMTVVI